MDMVFTSVRVMAGGGRGADDRVVDEVVWGCAAFWKPFCGDPSPGAMIKGGMEPSQALHFEAGGNH